MSASALDGVCPLSEGSVNQRLEAIEVSKTGKIFQFQSAERRGLPASFLFFFLCVYWGGFDRGCEAAFRVFCFLLFVFRAGLAHNRVYIILTWGGAGDLPSGVGLIGCANERH